jgi:uncharacterized damage-inducible protein DinB
MPASNPIEILLAHDKWATEQIIATCQKLTAEQFAKKFDMGPGSLQATITHIIGAIRAWTDTLAQRPQRPRPETNPTPYAPAQLLHFLEESITEFAQLARSHPLDEIVKRTRDGKEFSFTRGVVLTHVVTHGMHHRAQCLNMLKQLGVNPLPPSSIAEWSRLADSPVH